MKLSNDQRESYERIARRALDMIECTMVRLSAAAPQDRYVEQTNLTALVAVHQEIRATLDATTPRACGVVAHIMGGPAECDLVAGHHGPHRDESLNYRW